MVLTLSEIYTPFMKMSRFIILSFRIIFLAVATISIFSEYVLFDYLTIILMVVSVIFMAIKYFEDKSVSHINYGKKIRLNSEVKINKKFWTWMLIVWSLFAVIGYLENYDNLMILYVNIYVSVGWLLYKDSDINFLFCDGRGIWNISFNDKSICFDDIVSYRYQYKRIIIVTSNGEVKLPKYDKVFRDRLIFILDREVISQ